MSTTQQQALINYYANLLINQYAGKPKAVATIQAIAGQAIMPQAADPTLPLALSAGFNLTGSSPAVGVQLDILGKYAGVVRSGIGATGPVTLSDADFLQMILFATLVNNAGSSLSAIQQAIYNFFPGEVYVFDLANMQMSYLINSSIGSQNLIQLVVNAGLLPKPMGVQLASIIYAPNVTTFFGFRTYELPAHNASPFNDYASYITTWPWLTYQDALLPAIQLTDESGNVLITENVNILIE